MANILPFYLVCDESASMDGEPIDTMNRALPELHLAIGTVPQVCDKTRFSIVTFSDGPEVLLPLSDLSQVTQLPELQSKGGTNYAGVFVALKKEIENDIAGLKADGHRVFRPCVFFLSDGYPNRSDWETPLNELTDPEWKGHPNVLAFGIGDADPEIIGRVGTTKAFMVKSGLSPADALKEFALVLTRSIINSGSTGGDDLSPMMPTQVPGFEEIPSGFAALPSPEI